MSELRKRNLLELLIAQLLLSICVTWAGIDAVLSCTFPLLGMIICLILWFALCTGIDIVILKRDISKGLTTTD